MTFQLPYPGSPEIAVDNSHLTGLKVFVDGARQARLRQGGRPTWGIATADGKIHRVSFRGTMTGLRAIVDDDTVIELERRLALWELVLVALPIGLIGLDVLLGGLAGIVGVLVNLSLVRGPWPAPVRAAAMVVVFALAGLAWYLGEIALTLLSS